MAQAFRIRPGGVVPDGVPPDDVPPADDDALATAMDPANLGPNRLAHLAATVPDQPFLTETASGRTLTFRETYERVLRWAVRLERAGVGPADRVVSTLPASVDAICVWFAVSLLRAYEVAVDPALRGEFLRHVLTDSGAALAVVRPQHTELVGAFGMTLLEVDPTHDALAGIEPTPRDVCVGPGDVCCVIYTSGTTGPAKGVVITWGHMTALLGRVPRSWFGPDEVTYAMWPMFHVTGRSPVITMLDTVGRIVLRERFSRTDFWPDVQAYGITHASLAAIAGLLADDPGPEPGEHPLRIVLGGSDPGILRFTERFGVTTVNNYGSTEIGFPVTNRRFGAEIRAVAGWPRRGYTLRVVDEQGRELGPGGVGELHIRPPARELMLREYLGRPDLTARATADGWYHTGDRVELFADGGFRFVDRMRDTIRRFGENISSTAVEHVVLGLDEVAECAVVGVESRAAGQEVLLVLVPEGGPVDEAGLVSRLSKELPKHAVPLYVRSVETLPKTANGKVRKTELANLAEGAWRRPD
ncbi:AMP-binding protein [Pseudonocardia sp. NPDC049154]|uniref:class I adenylate-forming enzyme family protein n=1 Tax=Pseudonocardia sp. NPDC049154 TaxID=3155501 RepID=UPI0033FB1A08